MCLRQGVRFEVLGVSAALCLEMRVLSSLCETKDNNKEVHGYTRMCTDERGE